MRGIACIGSVVRIHLFKNLHRCLSINFSVHFHGTQRHAHFHPLLQMRMGGVQNRGMAPKPHWSGPPRGRTWLSSQTATFLGTSSLLVSEAGRHPGPSALPRESRVHVLAPLCLPSSEVLGQAGVELWSEPLLLLSRGQARHSPLCRRRAAGGRWPQSVRTLDCSGQLLSE